MKRIISVLLTAALLFASLCTVSAFAADTYKSGNYTYSIVTDKTIEITKYSGADIMLVIPFTIDGYTVVSIGSKAFYGNEDIETVVIPDTVSNIGEMAFCNCSALTDLTLSKNLKTIDKGAFAFCPYLKDVSLPATVTEIGDIAFFECDSVEHYDISASVAKIGSFAFNCGSSLKEINVASNNTNYSSEDGVLYNKDKTILYSYPAKKEDTSFEVPDSVETVDAYAFYSAAYLEKAVLYNVLNINDMAFSDCKLLSDVQMSMSIQHIGEEAFIGSKMNYISIPDTIIFIGAHAFGYEYNEKEQVYLALAGFKVYGKSNSVAEMYAKKNGLWFMETSASVRGDINLDNSVDITDVINIRAHIVGIDTFNSDELSRADVNFDGNVDIIDVIVIRSWIVNYH